MDTVIFQPNRRYGYRPIPSEIDTAELEMLREALVRWVLSPRLSILHWSYPAWGTTWGCWTSGTGKITIRSAINNI